MFGMIEKPILIYKYLAVTYYFCYLCGAVQVILTATFKEQGALCPYLVSAKPEKLYN